MAVKIRLQRRGARHASVYRLVAADSRSPRDGRFIEILGFYNPRAVRREEELRLRCDRIDYWIGVGAQPSNTARSLIRRARRENVRAAESEVSEDIAPTIGTVEEEPAGTSPEPIAAGDDRAAVAVPETSSVAAVSEPHREVDDEPGPAGVDIVSEAVAEPTETGEPPVVDEIVAEDDSEWDTGETSTIKGAETSVADEVLKDDDSEWDSVEIGASEADDETPPAEDTATVASGDEAAAADSPTVDAPPGSNPADSEKEADLR